MKIRHLPPILGLLLVAACGPAVVTDTPDAGPADSAGASTPKQAAAKVGSVITLQGGDENLKVAVKLAKTYPIAHGGNEFNQPQSGKRFYAVQLTLKNVGKATYSDSPSNGAFLIDSKGQQHTTTFADIREAQGFAGGAVTMSAGDIRRGALVFEVPKRAKIAKFQFALDSGFADHKAEWSLTG